MPRLLIGAVLVNVSWDLCLSLLETTNIIGTAINTVLWEPFQAGASTLEPGITVGNALENLFGIALGAGAVGAVVGGAALAGWFASGGWMVILSSLLPILGVFLVAFAILAIREGVIIALMLVSPVAVALWMLPGTEEWAKRWWGLFSKLLLMFPLFMIMLTAGQILSEVTYSNGGGFEDNIISIAFFVAPYFMLPFLFKFVGGFMGQVAGMINDREKGIFDRTKNFAKDKHGKSNWMIRRKAEKDAREGIKGSFAKMRGQQGVLSGLDKSGMRGPFKGARAAKNRASLYGYGLDRLDKGEQSLARASLEDQVKQQKLEIAKAEIKSATADKIDLKAQQDTVARMYDDAKNAEGGPDTAMMAAAFSELVRTQAVGKLEEIQQKTYDEASQLQASGNTAAAQQVLTAYNQLQGANYSDVKAFAGHLAGDISLADSDGNATSLGSQRLKNLQGLSSDQLAGQKGDTWHTYSSLDSKAAANAVQQVVAAGGSSASRLAADAKVQVITAREQKVTDKPTADLLKARIKDNADELQRRIENIATHG